MNHTLHSALAGAILLAVASSSAHSQDTTAAKPATHAVRREAFKIAVDLEGVLEAKRMTEVSLKPEEWADLTVATAVPQGTRVKPGDVLVQFQTKEIDESIADLAAGRELAELTLKQAIEDVKHLEKTHPLELVASQRTAKQSGEDLKRFLEIDRPQAEKNAEFSLKLAGQMLEYQSEELRQLEKMYKADDLTEETEEIILKRTRNEVEQAKHFFEQAKLSNELSLKVTLPRKQQDVERAAASSALEWEKARTTLPIALNQKRLALAKAQRDDAKATEKLAKLKQDREKLTVKATAEGIVYYGRSAAGKWASQAEVAAKLRPGGKVVSGEVFITIVDPQELRIRASVAEKNIAQVRPEMVARVTPAGYPQSRLTAQVSSVSEIPTSPGAFEVVLTIVGGRPSAPLAAGMSCKASVQSYLKPDALPVPSAAVFADDADEDKQYVFVMDAAGKPQRRDVTVGQRSDDKVEITAGLNGGETISLKKP